MTCLYNGTKKSHGPRNNNNAENMVMMATTGGNDHFDQHDESCDNKFVYIARTMAMKW